MKRMLILYSSSYGQTLKIATYIADLVRAQGWSVDLVDTSVSKTVSFDEYQAVMAGASVQASGYQKHFRNFISANASKLADKPSAFFSVCLGILQADDANVQLEERNIVHELFDKSGWYPDFWTIFAGGLAYSKYSWVTRQVMKYISKQAGGDTDTSRDYEYTNWSDVRAFVSDFLHSLQSLEYAHKKMTNPSLEWSMRPI